MASDGITIATSFAYTRDQLRAHNNISYLFNPTWNPDGDARAGRNTLPMALLHITKEQEIGQSQLSSQQMILYSGESTPTNKVAQAQLDTIADNIVNQPKQYQIEALLPATYDALIGSPFNTGGYRDPYMMAMKYEDYSARGGEDVATTAATLSFKTALGAIPNSYLDIMQLLSALGSQVASTPFAVNINWQDVVTTILNGASYNKDSFEAMWYSRSLLKYKPPMEWSYKTVAITHYNCSKNPTEDNCYRLSLTLQEVPILAIAYYSSEGESSYNTITTKTFGKGLSAALGKACIDVGS